MIPVILLAFLTFLVPQTFQSRFLLKDIKISYEKDKPDGNIREVDGLSADINAGFGGDHVWLVPLWTTDVSQAVTSIEVIVQDDKNPVYSDMASGAGGSFRYLRMIRDPTARTRIGYDVKLYRTRSKDSKPPKFGYVNYSGDINAGRSGDFLYVCWKNVDV